MPRSVRVNVPELARLAESGLTDVEIAERMGINRDTVLRHRTKLGIGDQRGKRQERTIARPLDAERTRLIDEVIERFGGRVCGVLFGAWPGLGRLAYRVLSQDEIEAACRFGLVQAAARYDRDKHGCALTTYAGWWMRNAVQQEMAAARGVKLDKSKRVFARAAPVQWAELPDGSPYDEADPKAGLPGEELERRDSRAAVRRALARMEPRRAAVLERLLAHGDHLNDVAAELGVSRARVQQLRDQGIKGFRDQWEGDQ